MPVPAPTVSDLQTLIERISERVGRHLERRGLLVRDAENAYLAWDSEEATPLDDLAGHAIIWRIAVGPNRGQKAFTLQNLPAREADPAESHSVVCAAGFCLHAGVAARACQRDKLERLCRYTSRPAVAEPRLPVTAGGHIRYSLKTPWRGGTTHVLFEPLELIAHIPVRYPSGGRWPCKSTMLPICHPQARSAIDSCEHCGGAVRIVASIETPAVIEKILAHINRRNRAGANPHAPRAPPVTRTDQQDSSNPFSRAIPFQAAATAFFVCCT